MHAESNTTDGTYIKIVTRIKCDSHIYLYGIFTTLRMIILSSFAAMHYIAHAHTSKLFVEISVHFPGMIQ